MAALFAVFLLYSYTQEKSEELTKDFGTKKSIVVASKDINEMETINETMLQMVERPEKFIEPNAVLNVEEAVGLVALAPIKEGEQVLQSKIIKPGPVTGLSLQVAPTKRAIAIPMDEVRGVAKLMKPGDRIDLIAAIDVGSGQSRVKEVKTIMQDVAVLSTGLRVANELPRFEEDDYITNTRADTQYSVITVEASPDQAEKLIYILATAPGSLFATLRHPSDRSRTRRATTNVNSVLGRIPTSMVKKQIAPPRAQRAKAKPKKKKRKGPFRDL